MVSRLAGLFSIVIIAVGLFPSPAQAQAAEQKKTHLIAVILDDSNSMSIDEDSVSGAGQTTSAEGSDPKGSAAFAVAQLLRLAPEGTHFLVYTYASIRNGSEPTLLKRTLTSANRANALQEFVQGIEQNSDGLNRAGAHGHGAHPYAINETPCQRAIESALGNIEGTLANWTGSGLRGTVPTDVSVIYLTDGRCWDPALSDPSSAPDTTALFSRFRELNNSRFYFIRFRTTQAAPALADLALALGGAAPDVEDGNPLEALRVFGRILGRIQSDPNAGVVHASHVTRGHEPLDFSQASRLDYVFAADCGEVDFCSVVGSVPLEAGEIRSECVSQQWLWWPATYYRDTKLSYRSAQGGTPQFCWYSGAVTPTEVPFFDRALQQLSRESRARNGMLWVHAEYHLEPHIRLCAGQCGSGCGEVTLRKKDEWHTPDESSTLCLEGRILAHPLGQPVTHQTLQVAFAQNPETSPTLDGTGLSPVLRRGGTDVSGISNQDYPSWTYTGGFSDSPCTSTEGEEQASASFQFGLSQADGLIDRETESIEICRCINADNDDFCRVEDCDDTELAIGGAGQPCREELADPNSTRLCSGWEPGQISSRCAANWQRDVDGACCCMPVPPPCPGEGDNCKVPEGEDSPCLECQGAKGEPKFCSCCDGVDSDCDTKIDEGFPNYDGDSMADCVDPDDDNDGISDVDDCEPRNEKVHPGATELCNGINDDCDKQVDNVVDGVDEDCEVSDKKGACWKGKTKCQNGGWICKGPDPQSEQCCDRVDSDCDGFVDEGCDHDCDGIQDCDPAEKDSDQDGCENGDDPEPMTAWTPGPTPVTCSQEEIKKAGSIPRPQKDCRCSGWRWSLAQLSESDPQECVHDKQSNVWKLDFGLLTSQAGAKTSCWVDPDKTCFRVRRADGKKTDEEHGFKPYLLKPSDQKWKSQADNSMFEFPILVESSTPWIGPLDDFQELAIRLKPALDMKALPEVAPDEPFKFELDVQLAGRDVNPPEYQDKTATIPLRIEGEYTAYLGLVPGGGKGTALDISLPSGETESTLASALMEISAQLPGKTVLDAKSHFAYDDLAERLCDFGDCEDEDPEARPHIIVGDCGGTEGHSSQGGPVELARTNEPFSRKVCLAAVELDYCKGHVFSFGCAKTARSGETFTVDLTGLTIDGKEVSVSRSVPVVLTVQRTWWDWFWAYFVLYWLPVLVGLILIGLLWWRWWNRRKNCFRVGQRVVARAVVGAVFDGDARVKLHRIPAAKARGDAHLTEICLDREEPGDELRIGAGWKDGPLEKADEYFIQVAGDNSPLVLGVVPANSPIGGSRSIKYETLFETYDSEEEARYGLGRKLPALVHWDQAVHTSSRLARPGRPLTAEQEGFIDAVSSQASWFSSDAERVGRSVTPCASDGQTFIWIPLMQVGGGLRLRPRKYELWEFVFVNTERELLELTGESSTTAGDSVVSEREQSEG